MPFAGPKAWSDNNWNPLFRATPRISTTRRYPYSLEVRVFRELMPEATIILAGGGTGGHLYPGIAVAQALATVLPGSKPLFLCTTREIDRVILEPTGFEFYRF
jgi:hypothetical protein